MVAVIVLYQDWFPFLLAIGYVFFHHGVVGVLNPASVYNHPDAFAYPWKWAAIHGGFVLAASIANIVSWRINEVLRAYSELILNSTGEGIIGLDLQGKITFMNPAAAEMTGYQVEELRGQPLAGILRHNGTDGVHPFENQNSIRTLTQAGPVQSAIEGTFWHKNGTHFMAEYITTPIRQAGSVVGAVIAFTDVTERIQAQIALQNAKDQLEIRVAERTAELEEANTRLRFELAERRRAEEALAKRAAELEESRNFLDSMIENIPSMLFTKDARDLSFVRFNQAGVKLLGIDAADIIGKNDYHLFPRAEADFFIATDREALVGGKLIDIPEEVVHTAHNGVRTLHTRKVAICGTDGTPKYLLGISEDITERKQVEAALRQSEQRFRQVVSSISDHIYVTELTQDGQRLNLYMSSHIEPLTGYPLDRFMADWSFWPSTLIHPDDRTAAAAQAERLALGQDSELEYRMIRANDDIIWVRDSGRVEKDTTSKNLIIYGLVSDITERKQAEAALALARDQALESSRLKTELLAKVSHELRTPLGAILGFTELLEMHLDGPDAGRQRQMTAEIIDSTHYLTNMVNELLDQAQLDAGRLELNIHPFAPAELLDDALTRMSVLAQIKGLSLTGELAPDLPSTLTGDIIRLQQILVNLIGNAIKFTSAGGVQVRLYRPDAGQWALQVSDTGTGIPVEAQSYIFEPFRQVDGSITRAYTGTGLGLSIVKQLTTLMRGEIILESDLGRGSRFTVILPMLPIQEKIP
jgi:PAS domain S-box-containing protein